MDFTSLAYTQITREGRGGGGEEFGGGGGAPPISGGKDRWGKWCDIEKRDDCRMGYWDASYIFKCKF